MKLLITSVFYDVPMLKHVCEQSLVNKITKDTALEIYKAAKLYNAEVLMKAAREMIIGCKTEGRR